MEQAVKNRIQVIGQDLDRCIFPDVLDGGTLVPGARPVAQIPGKERAHHGQQSRKADPSSAPRAPGTSAASGNPGASGDAAPFARTTTEMEVKIESLKRSYPGTRSYPQAHGIWLQIPCAVLPDLGYDARIILAINSSLQQVSAWGFWVASNVAIRWIGDRHTNYCDGSICAFDGRDDTWRFGESLVKLVDIYATWIFRHLHLEVCGYWPGPQSAERRLERMSELKPNEHCGCDAPRGTYEQCCMPADLATEATPGHPDQAKTYERLMYGLERITRKPPAPVIKMVLCAKGKPDAPEFTTNLIDWLNGSWLSPAAT